MCVVMYHIDFSFFNLLGGNLGNTIVSFMVPMFYFLSGIVFKPYECFSEFLRKKVNGLLVPLMFFHLLTFSFTAIIYTIRGARRREEGLGWGTRVYLWRIHVGIWQNQYNIVKLKNKIKFFKKSKRI